MGVVYLLFQTVNGYEDIDRNMFFKFKEGSRTRGRKAALVKVTPKELFWAFVHISVPKN